MQVFEKRGKPEYLSEQSREPTNSTHIRRRVWESNSSHIGGRQVLSPLRHHYVTAALRSIAIQCNLIAVYFPSTQICKCGHLLLCLVLFGNVLIRINLPRTLEPNYKFLKQINLSKIRRGWKEGRRELFQCRLNARTHLLTKYSQHINKPQI